jgi:hypothetical protein
VADHDQPDGRFISLQVFLEMNWVGSVRRIPLLFVHCAVLILVIVSMIEVYEVLAGIIRDLGKGNRIALAGALAAALLPSGAFLFWASKAIAAQFSFVSRVVRRDLRNQ